MSNMWQPTEENEEMNCEALDICSISGETVNTDDIDIISQSPSPLQEQLQTVYEKYQVMQNRINQVIISHIPSLLKSLDSKNSKLAKCHYLTNVGQIGGSAVALSVLLAPGTGGLSLIGGSTALVAWVADWLVQKKFRSDAESLHENFRMHCTPAWEAYDHLLAEINKFCDMIGEYNTESIPLIKGLRGYIQPKMVKSSSAHLVSLSPRALSYADDIVSGIAAFLKGTKNIPSKLASVLQKVEPLAARLSTLAPVVSAACSGYVLITTVTHFFEPSTASKDLVSYMSKLGDFKTDLRDLDNRMKLGIQVIKIEVNRTVERQEFKKQLEQLIADMNIQQQTFEKNLKTKEEQYQRQLSAQQEQFEKQLQIQQHAQQEQFERQLQIQKREHKEELDQFMQSQQAMIQKLSDRIMLQM